MLEEAAKKTTDLVVSTVKGAFKRFQKLKWVGKLVVVALLLTYIALAVVFIVIGPETIFQVLFRMTWALCICVADF